jgi:hypothetical protein
MIASTSLPESSRFSVRVAIFASRSQLVMPIRASMWAWPCLPVACRFASLMCEAQERKRRKGRVCKRGCRIGWREGEERKLVD